MSISFSDINHKNFVSNNCKIIKKDNNLLIETTNVENNQNISVNKIKHTKGFYQVKITSDTDGLLWSGTYDNNTVIPLNKGNNLFAIKLSQRKDPFDINISFKKCAKNKKIEIKVEVSPITINKYKTIVNDKNYLKKNEYTAPIYMDGQSGIQALMNRLTLKIDNSRYGNSKRISIVMAYYNRKEQTIITLNTIANTKYKNFSVIIVDDGSSLNHRLDDIIYRYEFDIKLIYIDPKNKTWLNPCIPYNIGFEHADGDIIIIQNPEVCHIGDVISYVAENLKEEEYLSFGCFASPSFSHNKNLEKIINESDITNIRDNVYNNFVDQIHYEDFAFDWKFYTKNYPDAAKIKKPNNAFNHWLKYEKRQCNKLNIYAPPMYIKWKGWYSHHIHNRRSLHFLTATYSKNIYRIHGFDEKYRNGLWGDDIEFLTRISTITTVNILPLDNVFAIHQFHDHGSVGQSKLKNFKQLIKNNKIMQEKLIASIKNNTFSLDTNTNNFSLNIPCEISHNRNIDNIKIGIAVTTYSDEKTPSGRIKLIDESFESLKNNKDKVEVIVVVDGPCNPEHAAVLQKYETVFKIIYKEKNGGVAKAKNTCIKELLSLNTDINFLADDDMKYTRGWYRIYASNIIKTGYEHLCYWPLIISKNVNETIVNDVSLIKPKGIAGCLLTFTKNIIDKIGYFRVFPYKYGFFHQDFTFRCVKNNLIPQHYDIKGSNYYLNLIETSLVNKCTVVDKEKLAINRKVYESLKNNKKRVEITE